MNKLIPTYPNFISEFIVKKQADLVFDLVLKSQCILAEAGTELGNERTVIYAGSFFSPVKTNFALLRGYKYI